MQDKKLQNFYKPPYAGKRLFFQVLYTCWKIYRPVGDRNLITITPHNITRKSNAPVFGNNEKTDKNEKKQQTYSDPLMQWPARGLAYSNELGAAISEVAPKLGTLLWFPAMLYFGADIYDKYKNEKSSYNPDGKRGTEQAIFQLLASVILPTGAVIAGQKTASAMGVMDKTGLSLQSREEVINFLQEFTSRRHIDNYENDISGFKEHFRESLITKREKLIRENKIKNSLKFLGDAIFGRRHPESLAMSQKDRVLKYADTHIDNMFKIYDDLKNARKPAEFTSKMWKKFGKLKEKYAKDPDYKATFIRDAAEDIIKKYQKSKIMNAKILKTVGGFIALGLAIKPIDNFVEHVVIKKVVKPAFTGKHKNNKSEKSN